MEECGRLGLAHQMLMLLAQLVVSGVPDFFQLFKKFHFDAASRLIRSCSAHVRTHICLVWTFAARSLYPCWNMGGWTRCNDLDARWARGPDIHPSRPGLHRKDPAKHVRRLLPFPVRPHGILFTDSPGSYFDHVELSAFPSRGVPSVHMTLSSSSLPLRAHASELAIGMIYCTWFGVTAQFTLGEHAIRSRRNSGTHPMCLRQSHDSGAHREPVIFLCASSFAPRTRAMAHRPSLTDI
jgi:hypothetical protein